MKTILSGYSDDNIELSGAIQDEVGCYAEAEKGLSFSFSDGTKGKIEYDGNWNITVKGKGSLFEKLVLGNPAEDPHTDIDCKDVSAYSDALVMLPGIEWVRIGRKKFNP